MSDRASAAVFLSYASQDAEAARRLCEALRAAGIEVWFDQNELVGGDAWDAKIRGQVATCALFLPLISANTEARLEGYFRIEWKLAAQRTHAMADEKAFLLPVVLDATREGEARVPGEFRQVQWTRLPEGRATEAFVSRVEGLLGPASPGSSRPRVPSSSATGESIPPASPAPARRRSPARAAGIIAAASAVVAGGFLLTRRQPPSAPAPAAVAPPAEGAAKPAPAVAAKSVAVLPFKNLSPDKDNEFFAVGMHEDVIIKLGRIRDLTVISQPTMLAYRDEAATNFRKIGEELRVATLLTGSVRRSATQVKVSAQLIDARSGQHVWGNEYLRELTDVFALQAEIAQEIALALRATLLPQEQAQLIRRPTGNQEAYDAFVQARRMVVSVVDYTNRRERYEEAITLLEKAVRLDRNFAEAYQILSLAHGHMYRSSRLDPTPARLARLREVVETVSRIAPDLAETKVARGNLHFFGLDDFARALVEYRAALADLPNDSEVWRRIAYAERRLGRWREALASFDRAVQLDPKDAATGTSWVQMFLYSRRFREADEALRRIQPYLDRIRLAAEDRSWLTEDLEIEQLGDLEAARQRMSNFASRRSQLWRSIATGAWAQGEEIARAGGVSLLWPAGAPLSPGSSLNRAALADLRGDRAAARSLAEETLAGLTATSVSPRLQPGFLMLQAAAENFAGRTDRALENARTAMRQQEALDLWDSLAMREIFGQILIQAGRRDEALTLLKTIFTGPSVSGPNLIRLHPVWSRLKDDPRFEEILKSAKPL